MGPKSMRSSVVSHHASVSHMIYLANENDPGERRLQTRQDHDVTLGINSLLVIFLAFIIYQ